MSLKTRLLEIMHERRPPLTQRAFADTIGVTQGAVAGWLEGTKPYLRNIDAICEAFDVKRDWLLYGEGPKREKRQGRGKTERSVTREDAPGNSIEEKITFIEKTGTPEQIRMAHAFLDTVSREIGLPSGKSPRKRRRG